MRASSPVDLGEALGGAAGRRAQQRAHALGHQDLQDGLQHGGLADAGPAGEDQQLRAQRQRHRRALLVGERDPVLRAGPGERLVGVDRRPRRRAGGDRRQVLRDGPLGGVQRGEEARSVSSPTRSRTTAPAPISSASASVDSAVGTWSSVAAWVDELALGQAAVALVHRLGERVADAGADADHRRRRDARAWPPSGRRRRSRCRGCRGRGDTGCRAGSGWRRCRRSCRCAAPATCRRRGRAGRP